MRDSHSKFLAFFGLIIVVLVLLWGFWAGAFGVLLEICLYYGYSEGDFIDDQKADSNES